MAVVDVGDEDPKAPAVAVGAGLPARAAPAAVAATVLPAGAAASVAMDRLWNRDCRNCLTAPSSVSMAVTAVAMVSVLFLKCVTLSLSPTFAAKQVGTGERLTLTRHTVAGLFWSLQEVECCLMVCVRAMQ